MLPKMVDWTWVWVLSVCCCLIGALGAYERSVHEEVPGLANQRFLLILKQDVPPQDRMQLRDKLGSMPGLQDIKWLSPGEVLERILRQTLTPEEMALVENQVPQVIELLVPTRLILDERLRPDIQLKEMPQIERIHWNEGVVSAIEEERSRWEMRVEKIRMGLLIGSVIIVSAAFLLCSQRNQLRLVCEQKQVRWESYMSSVDSSPVYLGTFRVWIQAMVLQGVVALVLTFCLLAALSNILTFLDTAPNQSLLSTTSWGFLWASAGLAFIGKGLDLFRVWMRYQRINRLSSSLPDDTKALDQKIKSL